jgi:hypothetical protein
MLPSLMGNFNIPTLIAYICSTLVFFQELSPLDPVMRVTLFRKSYLQDPWVLPLSSKSVDGFTHVEMPMSLFATEIAYQTIQHNTVDLDQNPAPKTPKKETDFWKCE